MPCEASVGFSSTRAGHGSLSTQPNRFFLRLPQLIESPRGVHANLDRIGFKIVEPRPEVRPGPKVCCTAISALSPA